MTDLELEFEHIYLEVRAERWQQIDRFLFSYFCFREGYVTKNGKPDWELARENAPRSYKVDSLKNAELEPIVPLEVVIGEIKRYFRDGELTPSVLRRILDSLLTYTVITRQEKALLRNAALQNAMPISWYKNGDKNPYLRFNHVDIKINQC
ncbi:hypothetical protein [Vibrio japonicus]|uniref:Uncharacterized protein n=1 Tax=Vibrio japonicus TaxID=1824638 RepID=A0ABY5LF90_9VIBR|nr:hypothetical protein [Vibrio japonicus]UUM29569.1 hypothetical protein NP165_07515 [Vibrio japonicus]